MTHTTLSFRAARQRKPSISQRPHTRPSAHHPWSLRPNRPCANVPYDARAHQMMQTPIIGVSPPVHIPCQAIHLPQQIKAAIRAPYSNPACGARCPRTGSFMANSGVPPRWSGAVAEPSVGTRVLHQLHTTDGPSLAGFRETRIAPSCAGNRVAPVNPALGTGCSDAAPAAQAWNCSCPSSLAMESALLYSSRASGTSRCCTRRYRGYTV